MKAKKLKEKRLNQQDKHGPIQLSATSLADILALRVADSSQLSEFYF